MPKSNNISDPPSAQAQAHQSEKRKYSQNSILACCITAAIAILLIILSSLHTLSPRSENKNILKVSGRIESDESHIASLTAGRVQNVFVREGENVRRGQELVALDEQALTPSLDSAREAVRNAELLVSKTEGQTKALEQQIAELRAEGQSPASEKSEGSAIAQIAEKTQTPAGPKNRTVVGSAIDSSSLDSARHKTGQKGGGSGATDRSAAEAGSNVRAGQSKAGEGATDIASAAPAPLAASSGLREWNSPADSRQAGSPAAGGTAAPEQQNTATPIKAAQKGLKVITAPVRVLSSPLTAASAASKQISELQHKSLEQQNAVQNQITRLAQQQHVEEKKQMQVFAKQQALAEMKSREMQEKTIKAQKRMQLGSMGLMLGQAKSQLLIARADLIKARAVEKQMLSKIKQFKIFSPVDGVCTTSAVQPGDVVAPGRVLMTVMDPQQVYMRAFVPEGQIALVKLGQRAVIKLDLAQPSSKTTETEGAAPAGSVARLPGKLLDAHVSSIDSYPSFTPENVYFQNDRIRQVFGVKLRLDSPDGSAKPGMPCDADIVIRESKS